MDQNKNREELHLLTSKDILVEVKHVEGAPHKEGQERDVAI